MSERRFKVSLADLLIYIAAIAFFLTAARLHWPDFGSMIWLALYCWLLISCGQQIKNLANAKELDTRTRLLWIAIRVIGVLLLVIDSTNPEKHVYYYINDSHYDYSVAFSKAIFRYLTRSIGLLGLLLCLYSPGVSNSAGQLSRFGKTLNLVVAVSFAIAIALNAAVMSQIMPALVQMAVHGIDINENPFIAHLADSTDDIPNYLDNLHEYYSRSLQASIASAIAILMFLLSFGSPTHKRITLVLWLLLVGFAAYQLLVIHHNGLAAISPSWAVTNTLPDAVTMVCIGVFTALAGLVVCLVLVGRSRIDAAIAVDKYSRHPRLLSIILMFGIVVECYLITYNHAFAGLFGTAEPAIFASLQPSDFSIFGTIQVYEFFAAVAIVLLVLLLLRQLGTVAIASTHDAPPQPRPNVFLLWPVAAITLVFSAISFAHVGFAVWFDSDLAGWFFIIDKLAWFVEEVSWPLPWVHLFLLIGLFVAGIRTVIQHRRIKTGTAV